MNAQQVPQCKQRRVTYLLSTATSAGHLKYWRYGKTQEFRVKLNFVPKNSRTFYMELSRFTVSSIWKLAYSFSVYIILPENTHQYLFTAADNSPWNIFHSRFAIFRWHFWKLELKLRKCDISDICWSFQILTIR
jgi:hypothetical protein